MIRRPVREGARAARELGEALRGTPFRAALAVSAAAHVALLLTFGAGEVRRGREEPVRLMRVRILASAGPASAPAAPAAAQPRPAAPAARADRPGRDSAAPPALEPPVPPPDPPAGEREARIPAPPAPTSPDGPAAPPAERSGADATAAGLETAEAPKALGEAAGPAPPAGGGPESAGGSGDAAQGAGVAQGPPSPEGGVVAPPGEGAPGPGPPSAALLADLRHRIDARKVYPQLAVRNGWEGRVLVEMQVDAAGRLGELRLLSGSGHDVLDRATLAAVRRAAPFPPIGGAVIVPVEYRLTP